MKRVRESATQSRLICLTIHELSFFLLWINMVHVLLLNGVGNGSPFPIFLPGSLHRLRSLAGSQRVGHNWETEHITSNNPANKGPTCLVAQSCPTLCNSLDSSPPGSSVHGDFPGKNTGGGCHALLRGGVIFLTQGSNLGLLYFRQILYHLSYRGSPKGPIQSSN